MTIDTLADVAMACFAAFFAGIMVGFGIGYALFDKPILIEREKDGNAGIEKN